MSSAGVFPNNSAIFSHTWNLETNSPQGVYNVIITYGGTMLDKKSFTVYDSASEKIPDVKIPDWLKNNAKWWSDGLIDDSTFSQGLEFLIEDKIISSAKIKIKNIDDSDEKNTSDSNDVEIIASTPLSVSIKIQDDEIFPNEFVRLESQVKGDDPFKFQWFVCDEKVNSDVLLLNYKFTAFGNFDVKVIVTDKAGNSKTDVVTVRVQDDTITDDTINDNGSFVVIDPVPPLDVFFEPDDPFISDDTSSNNDNSPTTRAVDKVITYQLVTDSFRKSYKLNPSQIQSVTVSWTFVNNDGTAPRGVAHAFVDSIIDEPDLQYLGNGNRVYVEGDRSISAPIIDGVATFVLKDTRGAYGPLSKVDYYFENFNFDAMVQLTNIEAVSPHTNNLFVNEGCPAMVSVEELPGREVTGTVKMELYDEPIFVNRGYSGSYTRSVA